MVDRMVNERAAPDRMKYIFNIIDKNTNCMYGEFDVDGHSILSLHIQHTRTHQAHTHIENAALLWVLISFRILFFSLFFFMFAFSSFHFGGKGKTTAAMIVYASHAHVSVRMRVRAAFFWSRFGFKCLIITSYSLGR